MKRSTTGFTVRPPSGILPTYLKEQMDQPWAGAMIEPLLEAKDLAERELAMRSGRR